jgi:ferredoxin
MGTQSSRLLWTRVREHDGQTANSIAGCEMAVACWVCACHKLFALLPPASGLDLPHDCKLGVCMTCPAKLVSGKVGQGWCMTWGR